MRVISIGFDPGVAAEGPSASGDTRERHVKYAAALRRSYPNGEIEAIVKVPRSWSSRVREIAEGLRVHPVPCTRAAFAVGALRVATALLGRERIDVVTTHTPFDDGLAGVWLKRRQALGLNVQMRSSFLDMPWWIRQRPVVYRSFNLLGKWVVRRADTVRVVSFGEKARLEQVLPDLKDKLVCLPPLVNRGVFEKPIQRGELEDVRVVLQRRGLESARFVLFVGRLAAEKNLVTLLRAFRIVIRSVPDGVLVIGGDGPLRGGLEKLARALEIEKRLLWLGTVPLESLRGWYASAVGVVLPSFQEGFGKVIVESYLMERPVIVAPFVSAGELVTDGMTGFVAPDCRDAAWLADRMVYLLRHPDEARAMGQRGRTHVESYLLPEEAHLERLVGIWRDTATRARQPS